MSRPADVRLPDSSKPEVFVDLDGVLVDFYSAACALGGKKIEDAPEEALATCDVAWIPGYPVGDRAGSNHFWALLREKGPRWWLGLEMYDGALDFVRGIIEMVGFDNFAICTSPHRMATPSADGKVGWVDSVLAMSLMMDMGLEQLPTIDWVLTPAKHRVAAPGRILIDDNPDNCSDWKKKNGVAYLCDAPWNKGGMSREQILSELTIYIGSVWKDR